ncbi:hypothetical protein H2509_15135 [Stappia sp. F7233]|uniref:Uncharacterized protein n=1 Tax=Stappia albiluteola TaxID=2758565 RepID=A0A839AFH2_9HYPH|nr:hypothetical protein [Stappia albiluteola]MBA5778463.1 hypothetical protein [Stappia albiluteola]
MSEVTGKSGNAKPDRRLFIASALALLVPARAFAHHGWRWAEDGQFELTGIIRSIYLGPPHGLLDVDVEGAMWKVELGPPSRIRGAGLKEGGISEGQEVFASGHRSKNRSENVMKAERITVAGIVYDFYPNRSG